MSRIGKARRLVRSLLRRVLVLRALWRLKAPLAYFRHLPKQVLVWFVRSKEDTNFTYDLSNHIVG